MRELRSLGLSVERDNEAARKLYLALGFVALENNVKHDKQQMALLFDDTATP